MAQRFRDAVLVVNAHILVLHQHNDVDTLGYGTTASQLIRRRKAHRLALIVPPAARIEHGTWEINAPIAVQIIVTCLIAAGQIVVRWRRFLNANIRGSLGHEQQIVIPSSQITRGIRVLDGLAGAAIAATLATLVLLGLAAQHHVAANRHALAIDTHVQVFVVAPCAIHDHLPLAIVEALALGHAVQLTGIGRVGVGHPFVEHAIEFGIVEARALQSPEIRLLLGTVLCVT